MAHRGNILEQSDGYVCKSVNVGNGAKNSSTIDSYTSSDQSLSDRRPVIKLIKANRELNRNLDKAQGEL